MRYVRICLYVCIHACMYECIACVPACKYTCTYLSIHEISLSHTLRMTTLQLVSTSGSFRHVHPPQSRRRGWGDPSRVITQVIRPLVLKQEAPLCHGFSAATKCTTVLLQHTRGVALQSSRTKLPVHFAEWSRAEELFSLSIHSLSGHASQLPAFARSK